MRVAGCRSQTGVVPGPQWIQQAQTETAVYQRLASIVVAADFNVFMGTERSSSPPPPHLTQLRSAHADPIIACSLLQRHSFECLPNAIEAQRREQRIPQLLDGLQGKLEFSLVADQEEESSYLKQAAQYELGSALERTIASSSKHFFAVTDMQNPCLQKPRNASVPLASPASLPIESLKRSVHYPSCREKRTPQLAHLAAALPLSTRVSRLFGLSPKLMAGDQPASQHAMGNREHTPHKLTAHFEDMVLLEADRSIRRPIIGIFAAVLAGASTSASAVCQVQCAIEHTSSGKRFRTAMARSLAFTSSDYGDQRVFASFPISMFTGKYFGRDTLLAVGGFSLQLEDELEHARWATSLKASEIAQCAQRSLMTGIQLEVDLESCNWHVSTGAETHTEKASQQGASALTQDQRKSTLAAHPPATTTVLNEAGLCRSSPAMVTHDEVADAGNDKDEFTIGRHELHSLWDVTGTEATTNAQNLTVCRSPRSADHNEDSTKTVKFVISDDMLQHDGILSALRQQLHSLHGAPPEVGGRGESCMVERPMKRCLQLLADETSAACLIFVPQHIDEQTEGTFLRQQVAVLQDLTQHGISAACILIVPQLRVLTKSIFNICSALGTVCHSLPFKAYTRVGASDEKCAAILTAFIRQSQARAAASTEGMMSFHDWAHRPWITERASCHERFLAKCPGLNCMAAQVLLSLWSLREILTLPEAELGNAVCPPHGLVAQHSLRLFCEWRDLDRTCITVQSVEPAQLQATGPLTPPHDRSQQEVWTDSHAATGQEDDRLHSGAQYRQAGAGRAAHLEETKVEAIQALLRNGVSQSRQTHDEAAAFAEPRQIAQHEHSFEAAFESNMFHSGANSPSADASQTWTTPSSVSIHNAGNQPLHELKARCLSFNSGSTGQTTLQWRQPSLADSSFTSTDASPPKPMDSFRKKASSDNNPDSQHRSFHISRDASTGRHLEPRSAKRSKYFNFESGTTSPSGERGLLHSEQPAERLSDAAVSTSKWAKYADWTEATEAAVLPNHDVRTARSTPQPPSLRKMSATRPNHTPVSILAQGAAAGSSQRVSVWRGDTGPVSSVRAVLQARQALRHRSAATARRRTAFSRK